MLPLILLIFCAIPLCLIWIQFKWEEFDKKHGFVGPPTWSILGNIPDLRTASKAKKTYFKIVSYYDEFKTDTIRIRMGPMLMIFTRDLKILEVIANSQKFVKPNEYEYLKIWLGNSLVITSGERWFKLRKLITPAFHFQTLERFIPIFEEQTQILADKLSSLSTKSSTNVLPIFQAFALDVVSESAMGVKLNSQKEPHSKFVAATSRMLYLIHRRLMSPIYSKEWIWKLTSLHKEQLNTVNYINDFINDIIQKRREDLLTNAKTNIDDNGKQRLCLLDILLHSEMDGKPLTNSDIRGEVNTFMFAGHETSGGTLSFIMYLLALNQDAQDKLLNEIKHAGLDCKGMSLNMRLLNSIPYLDGVIKESLRIFPIFPMVPKKCTENVQIGNITLPANTFIGTTFGHNHNDEKYFPNPNKFLPERWLDEISNRERNAYAYQPFSAGIRNCVGQRFAMLELKTAIIKIIQRFKVVIDDTQYEPNLIVAFSMKPTNGIPLKFFARD